MVPTHLISANDPSLYCVLISSFAHECFGDEAQWLANWTFEPALSLCTVECPPDMVNGVDWAGENVSTEAAAIASPVPAVMFTPISTQSWCLAWGRLVSVAKAPCVVIR